MKKSLKWLSAFFAVVMLLSAAMTTTAMATDSDEEESTYTTYRDYIISRLDDVVFMLDGRVFVRGLGEIMTTEEYWQLRAEVYSNPLYGYYPNGYYPGYWPGYRPGYVPSYTVLEKEMEQYTYMVLPLTGTGYVYRSDNTSVATVDSVGRITALTPGTANIYVHNGVTTVMVLQLTVTPIDEDNTNVAVRLSVGDSTLYVGQTTRISAYLTNFASYPSQTTAVPANIELSVSDESIISVSGSTLRAQAEGKATLTATLKGTGISESVTIYVDDSNRPIYPSYPSYPGLPSLPSYPIYPDYSLPIYPGYGYPWYDYDYEYPYWGNVGNTSYVNWEKVLGIDTDVYDLDQKYSYVNGLWLRTFTLIPKDGTEVSEYDTVIKRMYVAGSLVNIAVRTPAEYEPEKGSSKPNLKPNPNLTKDEQDALKKAEEEAKKLKDLNDKIALALEGKMEWYDVYSDIHGDSYYNEAVKFALKNLYVEGNEDGTFGSNDIITYAYLEEVLCTYFTMTPEEMKASGIVTYEDGEEELTREEIALVFYRAAQKLGVNVSAVKDITGFKDYRKVDEASLTALAWALENNLLSINYENYLKPADTVNKVRLCTMLHELDKLANPAVED